MVCNIGLYNLETIYHRDSLDLMRSLSLCLYVMKQSLVIGAPEVCDERNLKPEETDA